MIGEPPVHEPEPILDQSDWTRQPGCDTCGGNGGGDSIGCGDCGDGCGSCGGRYDGIGPCPCCGGCGGWLFHDMALFAGLQGFKGPADQAQNGNFGFIEGFNFGAPLGIGNFGFQAGFAATQSNLSGDSVQLPTDPSNVTHNGTRHQYFFTGGIFRRAPCGGLQGGVVFDYMSDSYYYGYYNNGQQAHLKQIRSEASFIGPHGHEIGYTGSYAIGGHQVANLQLDPTDVFALFYRRQFEGGGSGRLLGRGHRSRRRHRGRRSARPLGKPLGHREPLHLPDPQAGTRHRRPIDRELGPEHLAGLVPRPVGEVAQISPFRPLLGVADNSTFLIRGSNWQQFQR